VPKENVRWVKENVLKDLINRCMGNLPSKNLWCVPKGRVLKTLQKISRQFLPGEKFWDQLSQCDALSYCEREQGQACKTENGGGLDI